MADDWDTVTKIGSKARGGASQRETVIRGKSALNAAQRSGAVIGTEKKMGAGNSGSKTGVEGQHLTKVARSEDIVPVKGVGVDVGTAIRNGRQALKPPLTQKDLANKLSVKIAEIATLESGSHPFDNKLLGTLERILKVHLTGANIGKDLEHTKKGDTKKADPKKPDPKKADTKAATKTSAK